MHQKNKKRLYILLEVIICVCMIVAVVAIAFEIGNPLLIFCVFIVLCIISAMLFFQLRFRLNGEEYPFHNVKYENYRADLEEKIRQLQEAVNKDYEHWKDNNHLVLSGIEAKDTLFQQFGVSVNTPIEKNTVFMLMPFHEDAVKVYAHCRKAVQEMGLRIKKSDDQFIDGDLLQYIVECIVKADIIIANLDGKNPNVFYELGIAHTLKKRTILITSFHPEEMPFNVKGRNIISYQSFGELEEKIKDAISSYQDR